MRELSYYGRNRRAISHTIEHRSNKCTIRRMSQREEEFKVSGEDVVRTIKNIIKEGETGRGPVARPERARASEAGSRNFSTEKYG